MAYQAFKKTTPRKNRVYDEVSLGVSLDTVGRLRLNQGFYNILIQNKFTKTEIFIDYDSKKIALKMLRDSDECTCYAKKLTAQIGKSRVCFLSFITVRNELKLKFPFVRNATWDEKNSIVEFTWTEESNA